MLTTRKCAVLIAAALLLSGCSSSSPAVSPDFSEVSPEPSNIHDPGVVLAPSRQASLSPTPSPTPTAMEPDPAKFPKGYPKIIKVSAISDERVRNDYKSNDYTRAVQLAPGVWTPLPEGAELVDALSTGQADGLCGSIKAYSRKYADNYEFAGSCW